MSKRIIFLSYSHRDREWLGQLRPNLDALVKARPDLRLWVDESELRCGDEFDAEIEKAIDHSVAAILLLSPHFFSSDYIMRHELPRLLARYEAEEIKILPFLLRPCRWKMEPWAQKLTIRPGNATPATRFKSEELDDHFFQLASEVEEFYLESSVSLSNNGDTPPESRDAPHKGNLPRLHDAFFGRQHDVAAISKRFAVDTKPTRLVTLLGTAGLGKTRLAKEIGGRLESAFPGGAWFVDLTPATTVTGICHEIWGTLGQPLASGETSPVDATAGLFSSLSDVLIILDNFEQVASFSEDTVGQWLQRNPNVCFLVTSRVPLDVDGERCVVVEPLKLPRTTDDIAHIRDNACVQLFQDRYLRMVESASESDLDLRQVAGICRDLEGIPLSIELAVAALEVLTLDQLKKRLQAMLLMPPDPNGPVRKPSLAAALRTSLRLLTPEERASFLRLSVFRDGFHLEAAEKLLDPEGKRRSPVFYTLLKLNKHSLLRCRDFLGEKRYFFFVSVREFAHHLWLTEVEEEERHRVIDRWSAYYLGYAQELSKRLGTGKASRALDRLGVEFENLLGVQEEALRRDDAILAAQVILLLAPLMGVRGPAPLRVPKLGESLAALERSLDRLNEPSLEARTLHCRLKTELSKAYWSQGEWNLAEEAAEEAALMATEDLGLVVRASALLQQARMLVDRGFLHSGLASINDAERLLDEAGSESLIATAEIARGSVLERLGELAQAQVSFQRAEQLAVKLGDRFQAAMVHNRRGIALWHHGHLEQALSSLVRAEHASRNLESRAWVGAHMTNQGLVLGDMERYDEAIRCFEAGGRSHRELGYLHWAAINSGGWGRTLMMRDLPGDSEAAIEKIKVGAKTARKVYYPEDIALHMGDLARLFCKDENWAKARRASWEAVALERRMGAVRDHRHFCNLVTHAESAMQLGLMDEAWDALAGASRLARSIEPASQSLLKVKLDRQRLAEFTRAFDAQSSDDLETLTPPAEIAGLQMSSQAAYKLHKRVAEVPSTRGFEYPWRGLERYLEESGLRTISLFAYGSLLNKASALQTISQRLVDPHRKATAFGVVRLLDYHMPPEVARRSAYRRYEDDLDQGLFNLRFTGFVSDAANGILLEVPVEEIEPLRRREIGYDLRPVVCRPWGYNEAEASLAYGLGCSGRWWQGHKLSRADLMPHPGYFEICRQGASALGVDFLEYFLDSSFLADGETTVRDWLVSIGSHTSAERSDP